MLCPSFARATRFAAFACMCHACGTTTMELKIVRLSIWTWLYSTLRTIEFKSSLSTRQLVSFSLLALNEFNHGVHARAVMPFTTLEAQQDPCHNMQTNQMKECGQSYISSKLDEGVWTKLYIQ